MGSELDHARLLVPPGRKVALSDYDPGDTHGFRDKRAVKAKLRDDLARLSKLQDTFYADRRYALLVILQGMDAAGKDGVIRHVMSGFSPQGVDVYAFKQPTEQELSHDYLWRCGKVLPERGRIAIFNRSYYEELTVVRVHRSLLAAEAVSPSEKWGLWHDRYEDVVAFERHLSRNATVVLKFFLHLSKEEQRKRLLERIDDPDKNWKISTADVHERSYWDNYQRAYEQLLEHTGTASSPWYVIPADRKWFSRAAVADVIVARLRELGLKYPSVGKDERSLLAAERGALLAPEARANAAANGEDAE